MKLQQLLAPWMQQDISNPEILGLQNDSRQVKPGDLFLAYPGATADGRDFIAKAIEAGASAVAFEPNNFTFTLTSSIPCIAIAQLGMHLADIAKIFYDNPCNDLNLIGITGTNGKTTIAYQLAQAHQLLGKESAAYIGTIGQGAVDDLRPINNTTPDALVLLNLLAQYKKQGIKQVCMEVSSHALTQHRVDALAFNQAIFTNLTLDHLDYHHTFTEYAAAKAKLFAREELQYAIINQDDAYQKVMSDALNPRVKKITYGLHEGCDVKALEWHMAIDGTQIEVASPWGKQGFTIKSPGQFNIYNSLAIWTSLMLSGFAPKEVNAVMSQLKPAPGRMEIVAHAPYVLVDYAHTPDALENALLTLKQLKKGQLWVVFGCGGDRDKTKRPIMGKAASSYADQIVVTSDNPRSEDPALIIEDIMQGIEPHSVVTQLVNREEAIAFALISAAKEDIILIAGKGHESYQQIGQIKHAFSDKDVVRSLIHSVSK